METTLSIDEAYESFNSLKSEIDGFMSGKHEVFPIPQIEIELTGNRWSQNTGY